MREREREGERERELQNFILQGLLFKFSHKPVEGERGIGGK